MTRELALALVVGASSCRLFMPSDGARLVDPAHLPNGHPSSSAAPRACDEHCRGCCAGDVCRCADGVACQGARCVARRGGEDALGY